MIPLYAAVAELADAADSKSAVPKRRAGSTPASGTNFTDLYPDRKWFGYFFYKGRIFFNYI